MLAHAYNSSTWRVSQAWGFHTSLQYTVEAFHKKPETQCNTLQYVSARYKMKSQRNK